MSFKIIKYQPEHKHQWDDFVRRSKNATFLFYRDFMDYHSDRFEDYSLMVFKENTLLALLPANLKGDTVFSHQGLTYGGYVLSSSTKLLDAFEGFKALLAYLSNQGIQKLNIRVIPSCYYVLPADELVYFLYKANAQLLKRDVLMLIDYHNKLGFQKNRREGINKAKRHQLEIQIDGNFEAFWNEILIPNLKHKHGASPVHTLEEIQLLAARFPQNIQQVNVYKDSKIVAGTTVFLTKTTVHPQYVSANLDKNRLGSLDYLYDFILQHYQANRRYFNFNTSLDDDGTSLKKGLLFWKESCGARTHTIDQYEVATQQPKTLNLL